MKLKTYNTYTAFSDKRGLRLMDENLEVFSDIDIDIMLEELRCLAGDKVKITVEKLEELKEKEEREEV